ncbi:hypothetical protein [Pseudoroseicyclus tamaricis]|uniref:Uncharacterized protein n=1 Tax=Pseudoroseicyclus tamaricis TaxID=2705421 RepID=A0A6B2K3U7_9RHOB|nr:hypothetical protein [Pseudoroseicyclus tamaricis]NDV01296.1 hypothetical protein [Pseudoroseicyclus tamaricis]
MRRLTPVLLLASLAGPAAAEATVTPNAAEDIYRAHATSFESATIAVLSEVEWLDDSIRVTQVDGAEEGILTEIPLEGRDGLRSWYPNGADTGYTVISMADGSPMTSVTLLLGNGNFETRTGIYRMMLDGGIVAEGSFENTGPFSRVRFDGARFDALWLRNRATPEDPAPSFGDGTANTLAIDAIEVRLEETVEEM